MCASSGLRLGYRRGQSHTSNYDGSRFAHEASLPHLPIARDSRRRLGGGHVRGDVTARSIGVRPDTLGGSPTANSSSRESPPPAGRLSTSRIYDFHRPDALTMAAGSLLLAVRSSCLRTLSRPPLLLAVFPQKVSPSWVSGSRSGFLSQSPVTLWRRRRQQRRGAFEPSCFPWKPS